MALSNGLSYNVTIKKSLEIIGKNRKALNLCLIIANLAVLAILGFVLFQRHNTKYKQVAKAEKTEQVANSTSSSSEKAKEDDETQLKKGVTTALRSLTTPMMSLPLITLSEGNQMMLRVR